MKSVSVSLALSAVFLILSACAPKTSAIQSRISTGILGGESVQDSDPVANVTVKVVTFPGDYDRTCTGVLIASRFVLTAAHCSTGSLAPKEVVLFDGTILKVKAITIHPKYDRANGYLYDFAVLELRTRAVSWALLPSGNFQMQAGDVAQIAGYGSHLTGDAGYGELYSLRASIDPNYSDVQIKVFEGPGVGACYGDSGGPLYQLAGDQVILLGIDNIEGGESGSSKTCGTSELYSNVQAVSGWIRRIAH